MANREASPPTTNEEAPFAESPDGDGEEVEPEAVFVLEEVWVEVEDDEAIEDWEEVVDEIEEEEEDGSSTVVVACTELELVETEEQLLARASSNPAKAVKSSEFLSRSGVAQDLHAEDLVPKSGWHRHRSNSAPLSLPTIEQLCSFDSFEDQHGRSPLATRAPGEARKGSRYLP